MLAEAFLCLSLQLLLAAWTKGRAGGLLWGKVELEKRRHAELESYIMVCTRRQPPDLVVGL